MVGQSPVCRLAHAAPLRCVIGCRETMNKLQRVARALPLSKPHRHLPQPNVLPTTRLTNSLLSSTAPNRARAHPSHTTRNMSSDAAYAAFLDKANQDSAPAEQQSADTKSYGSKSVNTAVPKALEAVEEYYVSDADEPFEPVALEYKGDSLSAGDLGKLLGKDGVQDVGAEGFEKQYKSVVDAVKKAGNGEVKAFKVDLEGARAEYFVLSVDREGGRVVGLKALSVES
ncbi:hypothetical protein C7974DRAFT_400487 [Boeremia exigua]|uniref:uncharacterized protein n=1 Tax=Boeremia exigua TaxID=749465 RepID=UPI001E8EA7EA|nr:uncharacterized protein C7974DRAFT_400487 [Boeremia exigua]KAH6618611.1 hypothetical protein C7974DRAFT_400487 [Boeremia exigua]